MTNKEVDNLSGWKKFLDIQRAKLIGGSLDYQTVTFELFRGQITEINLEDTELTITTKESEYCEPKHPFAGYDDHEWEPSSRTTFQYPVSGLYMPIFVKDHFYFQCDGSGSTSLYPKGN